MAEGRPILYVDDEPSNLAVFEAAFEDEYDVTVAESGAAALEILASQRVEVMITDMRMPQMNGVELLERVIERHPEVVRIVLTGYTDIESVADAVNSGRIYQYVTKPWKADEFVGVIDGALAMYKVHADTLSLNRRLSDHLNREETIRTIFQRYAPTQVAEQVADDIKTGAGDAQRREVTLLYSDIRGFTPLSHAHKPPEVLRLLNAYFALMTEVVDRNRGVVSQFRGDALLAIFGAPRCPADSEGHAARAALEMLEALQEFNRTLAKDLVGATIEFGIGIQSGVAAVGNVGCTDRFVYSAIGEPADQVPQVEARSKAWPSSIVTTDRVAEALEGRFELQPAGSMRFEGDDSDVGLHRIVGARG